MAVNATTVASEIVAQMNLATTYTATVSDPRSYTQKVLDDVLDADAAVVEAICSNPANGARAAFVTGSANVVHLGQLPSRLGPIDSVTIGGKLATLWSMQEIEYERANALSLTHPPHFAIEGNTLGINQGTAIVRYCSFTRGTSTCQSPDEYYHVVKCGAMSAGFSIEGENDSTAAMYGQQFQAMLAAIRSGQAPPPLEMAAK